MSREPLPAKRRAILARFGLALLLGFQLLTFHRDVGIGEVPSERPVVTDDYAYHYANALTVSGFLSKGRWWGYDPFLYAGYPSGALLSIDNRLLELMTFALGDWIHPAVVQKLYCLSLWIAIPLAGWVTSRAFGLGSFAALTNAGLAVALVECSLLHFFVAWGMLAFVSATLLAPAMAATYWSLLARWRPLRLASVGLFAQLLCVVHALAPLMAAVPILVASGLRRRDLGSARLAQLLGAALVLLVLNLSWALPALRFTDHYQSGGASSQLLPVAGAGDGVRILAGIQRPIADLPEYTGFRTGLVVLAGLGLVLGWKTRHREPLLVCAAGAVALLVACFGANAIELLREAQPIRFLPAALGFLLPVVSCGLAQLARSAGWRALLPGLAAASAVAVWGMPFYQQTLGPEARSLSVGVPPSVRAVAQMVASHTQPTARVLVEDSGGGSRHRYGGSHATALLPFLVPREFMLGPVPYAPLLEETVTLVEGRIGARRIDAIDVASLDAYFRRYNIGWVVAWSQRTKRRLVEQPGVWEDARWRDFSLFRIERSHSFFLQGRGTVEADYDRLILDDLPVGETIVLSYHFLETLRARSGQKIERSEDPYDPIGFIRIEDVPGRLEIENR